MADSGTITETTRSIIEQAYACAAASDFEGFAELLSDDVAVAESPNHPYPGSWQGKAEVLEAIGHVYQTLGMTKVDVRAIAADGCVGLGLIDLTMTGSDGQPFVMEVAEAWWVADGKVTEIKPFYFDMTELRERVS